MKTAVSLPEALYKDAEATAKSLGIPRSQLFAKALEEFIRHHRREDITQGLDAVYAKASQPREELQALGGLEALRELTKNESW